MKKTRISIEVRDYFAITIGSIITAIAYNWFIIPNNIAPGGVSGMATVVHQLIPILPVGTLIIIINVPLFLVSWKELGLGFGLKSLVGTVVLSLVIDFLPIPAFIDDKLLASVFGGVLLGIGLGIVLRNNGSTGGTDILAKLFIKKFPFNSLGTYILITDFIVIVSAGLVNHDKFVALYSLITVYVSTRTVDILQEGIQSAKAYYIISDKSKEISARILKEMDRGATFLKATGSFTGIEKNMIICLVQRSEIARIRRIIKEEDERAFVYVHDAREVLGAGFYPQDRKKII